MHPPGAQARSQKGAAPNVMGVGGSRGAFRRKGRGGSVTEDALWAPEARIFRQRPIPPTDRALLPAAGKARRLLGSRGDCPPWAAAPHKGGSLSLWSQDRGRVPVCVGLLPQGRVRVTVGGKPDLSPGGGGGWRPHQRRVWDAGRKGTVRTAQGPAHGGRSGSSRAGLSGPRPAARASWVRGKDSETETGSSATPGASESQSTGTESCHMTRQRWRVPTGLREAGRGAREGGQGSLATARASGHSKEPWPMRRHRAREQ